MQSKNLEENYPYIIKDKFILIKHEDKIYFTEIVFELDEKE